MDSINKAQALRMNAIMGQNELTKDLVESMKRMVEDHFNKLNRMVDSNGASISMINTTLDQNNRIINNLMHVIKELQDDIVELKGRIIELEKNIRENAIKKECQNEEEVNKDKSDEQRSQNKQEKGKGNEERANNEDDDGRPRPRKITEEESGERNIIEILRDDSNFNINSFNNEGGVNWAEMIDMVWEFIKSCHGYESMNRVNAI
jgi:hypothetical protein